MIAPLAISLALAFLQPYSAEPLCPNGVQIVYEQSALGHPELSLQAWVEPQDLAARDCRFHMRRNVADEPVPYQCVIVAHELGHAALGLPDSTEPGNIMHGPFTIPGACYPPTPPQKGPGIALRPQPRSPSHTRWAARRAQRLLVR